MAAPKSPFTELLESVQAETVLSGCTVLPFNASMAKQDRAPRIVLIPRSGRFKEQRDNRALAGVVFTVDARIWATNYDAAWDLFARLLQAVRGATSKAGYTWQFLTIDHESGEPDTSKNGVFLVVTFASHIDVSPATGAITVEIETVTTNITND